MKNDIKSKKSFRLKNELVLDHIHHNLLAGFQDDPTNEESRV